MYAFNHSVGNSGCLGSDHQRTHFLSEYSDCPTDTPPIQERANWNLVSPRLRRRCFRFCRGRDAGCSTAAAHVPASPDPAGAAPRHGCGTAARPVQNAASPKAPLRGLQQHRPNACTRYAKPWHAAGCFYISSKNTSRQRRALRSVKNHADTPYGAS